MIKWNIYTPEGFQDILFADCTIKREIERKTAELFQLRGFLEIQPPTIEFFDVFSNKSGNIKQEDMFKFFDQQGRILVLRPDLTTSAARIASTKLKQIPKPWRFSYIGNVFRSEGAGDGKLIQREFTQAGIEIMGSSMAESDAEVIETIINSIRNTGIEEFQIEIGQVEFFKGLMEEANFNEEESEQIRSLIESKNYIGLENELNNKHLSNKLKKTILHVPEMFGSIEVITNMYDKIDNQRSRNALDNLISIYDILKDYQVEKYVSFDLGMVQSINYYTGMIFKGLTHGVGSSICGGGRYDNLTSEFGEPTAAVGGAVGINRLMLALNRQNIKVDIPEIDTLVSYISSARKTAIEVAELLRNQGITVEMSLNPDNINHAEEYAQSKGIKGFIWIKDSETLQICDLVNKKTQTVTVKELLEK